MTIMKATTVLAVLVAMAGGLPGLGRAQIAVAPAADQVLLLASADPRLAANKRLVYDFWREVFEGAHMEFADKYMAETYIQHNPNVPTGRAAFVAFFSRVAQPKPIEARIKAPLVAIVAEGDLVVLSFAREGVDPKDATKKYSTTWFDMFRIENGKIAEHWDPAQKQ
jgi:predicted SnoaL-like aldol condensation-catalyzing enzyme